MAGQGARGATPEHTVPRAMADQGARGATEKHTVRSSMAGQGARGATAEHTVRVAKEDQGVQEAMAEHTVQAATVGRSGGSSGSGGCSGGRAGGSSGSGGHTGGRSGGSSGSGGMDGTSGELGGLDGTSGDEGELDRTSGETGENNPHESITSLYMWLAIFAANNPEHGGVAGVHELADAGVRKRAAVEVRELAAGSGLRMREEVWRTGVSEGGPEGASSLEHHVEDAGWW
ncbi:hypothetical protein M9458_056431 [Cirrhinus mrigala]|uniref:Uncharacterized protein n=1 Tax=Cirrhinus mrigala TaxID=683832 RepID=A0ABD0MF78_CIRMR